MPNEFRPQKVLLSTIDSFVIKLLKNIYAWKKFFVYNQVHSPFCRILFYLLTQQKWFLWFSLCQFTRCQVIVFLLNSLGDRAMLILRFFNPISPGWGGLFDPLYHESVCRIYRPRTRFTKIHDFVPFGICQDPVKLLLKFFSKKFEILDVKIFWGSSSIRKKWKNFEKFFFEKKTKI